MLGELGIMSLGQCKEKVLGYRSIQLANFDHNLSRTVLHKSWNMRTDSHDVFIIISDSTRQLKEIHNQEIR